MKSRRAIALLLTMIAVIVSTIVCYVFLSSQQTSIGIARNIKNHAIARYVAESGLECALDYIRSDSNWRTNRVVGIWAGNVAFGPGFYSVRCDDGIDTNGDGVVSIPSEGYADLNRKGSDPITLTISGSVNGCVHTVQAVVRPVYSGPIVLFVVGNPSSLTAVESERKAWMEGFEWQVNLLDDDSDQSQFDTASAGADVAIVSVSAVNIGAKLKYETIGVVNEYPLADVSFGFSSTVTSSTLANSNQIDIWNTGNYITSSYSIAPLLVSNVGSVQIDYATGTPAGGMISLGQKTGANAIALAILETNTALYGGGMAAERRVTFPFGRYLISQLNSDGLNLLRRSIDWASGAAGVSTFGYATRFGSVQGKVSGKQIATQVTLSEAGTLTSITACLKSGDAKAHSFRYALYSDSGGQPGSLLVQTSVNTVTVPSRAKWYKLAVTPTLLTSGTYWLAMAFDSTYMKYFHQSSGGQSRYNTNNAITGSFSSLWGSSSTSATRKIDLYGTYTPASGGASSTLNSSGGYSYEDIDMR